jgi:hypothetical protein
MNEQTKTVLLNRIAILNRDISWNKNLAENLRGDLESAEKVVRTLQNEWAYLVSDLKEAGVEVDVPNPS